ncbi:MAG: hypothetical protein JWM28_3727 [Chitinophagaceae bacterium]|nr:hypothetical protein [Chitinophagaceae bacterium]
MVFRKNIYDAVVIGAGPNGLSAAITLQREGLQVLLVEASAVAGGGARTAELTLPGFRHDVCSAVHPLAAVSPFFASLPLQAHGLEFIYPPISVVHPLDGNSSVRIKGSADETAEGLGTDDKAYLNLVQPVIRNWPRIAEEILSPLHYPRHISAMLDFAIKAMHPASVTAAKFHMKSTKALWAGMAAHFMRPFSGYFTSAPGIILLTAAHLKGWPFIKGGSGSLSQALLSYFISMGGEIKTSFLVESIKQLPPARAIVLDVSPTQLSQIAGSRFPDRYIKKLARYRYGVGVFKIDWALDKPAPFLSPDCSEAGTIHLGGSYEEIALAELQTSQGVHTGNPFVIYTQPSIFDRSRTPDARHTAWAYCHVPNGSVTDMTTAIENQVERFAPGFRKLIIGRHTMNTVQLEAYNSNYRGGDIKGGETDLKQLFSRPVSAIHPYNTPAGNIYICYASTPTGAGVHGMCGYHAAKKMLNDIFKKEIGGKI